MGVSLVQVPVSVLDRGRKPVLGLTTADFELRDEGKRVAILSLDVMEYIGMRKADASAAASLPGFARRKFVLLFDLSYATPEEVARARKAAVEFVRNQKGALDLVALAVISAQRGFNVVLDFTADGENLQAAIEERAAPHPPERGSEALAEFHLEGPTPVTTGDRPSDPSASQRGTETGEGRALRLLQAFDALAESLAAIPGRKNVIYLSHGFDIRPFQKVGKAPSLILDPAGLRDSEGETGLAGVAPGLRKPNRETVPTDSSQITLERTLAAFRASDILIHTVDLSGAPRSAGVESLAAIAAGTGGEALARSNDFASLLGRILDSTSVIYVLGFAPPTMEDAGRFHHLAVEVRRDGVKTFARAGYFEGGRPPRIGSEARTPKPPGSL